MVDYYVPHTLSYLCTKSLHHITHTTTWWVTVSHTLCTAYHIPLYHITYYEVLQYSTTLYHTQHHIPTLYIPLYPYPCFLPLYNTQKSNVLHTCSKHIRVCHSVEQFPDAVTVTLCQCIACMHRSLPYLHCPQVLYLPTNHIVWRDMLVQCKRSGVERGGGGEEEEPGEEGLRWYPVLAPAAAKQDTATHQLVLVLSLWYILILILCLSYDSSV